MSVVQIEMAGNRIHLRSSFPTAGLSKTVPGANFNRGSGQGPYWSVPLSLESCRALRDRFGDQLSIGPELWAWAAEEKARRDRLGALAEAGEITLERLPLVAPGLAAAMLNRPYQAAAARFIAEARNVLIADDPGLGKTLECIGGILESGVPGPYLIVCPKTAVESVWAREIPRWVPDARVITVPDGRAKRDKVLDDFAALRVGGPFLGQASRTWVVINAEMARTKSFWTCATCGTDTPRKAGKVELKCLHNSRGHGIRHDHTFPQLFNRVWGAIVCDESDRAIIRKSATLTQVRNGMEMLRDLACREDGFRVAASGTPFRSRPHLLWGTLNWLDPERYPAFWSWCGTFWDVRQDGWGGSYTIGKRRDDMEPRLRDALRPIMLRRVKEEVAKDLPPKRYAGTPLDPSVPNSPIGVWLEMTPEQSKAHDSILKSSFASLDGGALNPIGILAEMTRMKQFATCAGRMEAGELVPILPSNKYNWLKERLEEWGFPDDPDTGIIVVSQFTQVLELFARSLSADAGIDSVMLTGNVTGNARATMIERYNARLGPRLMFLNVKAGGVAITLDSADRMIMLDEDPIPDVMRQVEDRIHRVSNPRRVEYYYLRSSGSIEQAIAVTNVERDIDSTDMLDGARGVTYMRHVLDEASKL